MSPTLLLIIILIEGFITISAEILTIRQLLPLAGSSVIVTSLIIGVFLLFLAYGYRRGGQYKENYIGILKRNFSLSTLWLGIGLSYVFIYLFFEIFQKYFHSYVIAALISYLLLITAPLVYILGQTVPITMNLVRQSLTTGATGGKILHLSTIGSFLGAVITSLILMNFLGVAWTVFINSCLLAALVVILFSDKARDSIRLIILAVILVLVYRFNVVVEHQSFVATNSYANYEVLTDENKGTKLLRINDSASSFLDAKKHAFPYIELIKGILFKHLMMRNKDILILGAGGFTLSAESSFGNRCTYVDIDNDIAKIVQNHFLKPIEGQFVAEDARVYLTNTPIKYDAIVSDVYSNYRSIPAHLLTQEYFSLVNQALKSDGTAIINIVARPTLKDDYSKIVYNTIFSVFKRCMVIPIHYTTDVSNIVYVCGKYSENLEGKSIEGKSSDAKSENKRSEAVYTDDLNTATLDFFNSITK